VLPFERQLELRVGRLAECAGHPSSHRVTFGAFALVGASRELTAVLIGVTRHTICEDRPYHHPGSSQPRHGSERLFAMTRGAAHGGVPALERISALRVSGERKRRGGESFLVVTGGAVGRLPLDRGGAAMRIRRMAASARRRDRMAAPVGGEVLVAGPTGHRGMLAPEWELRAAVIEPGPRDLGEAPRVMARRAECSEAALVGILVAVGAAREHQLLAGPGMALGAFHLKVFAGERIIRGIVLEPWGHRPLASIVAGLAFLPERALVNVLVTAGAGLLQPGPAGPAVGGELRCG